jgi:hypothetical protein
LSSQNPQFSPTLFLTLYTPHFISNQITPIFSIHLLFPQNLRIHSLTIPINYPTLIKINQSPNSEVTPQIPIYLIRHPLITPSFSVTVNIPLYLSLISPPLTLNLNSTISKCSRKHLSPLFYPSISTNIKIAIYPFSLPHFHFPLCLKPHIALKTHPHQLNHLLYSNK